MEYVVGMTYKHMYAHAQIRAHTHTHIHTHTHARTHAHAQHINTFGVFYAFPFYIFMYRQLLKI